MVTKADAYPVDNIAKKSKENDSTKNHGAESSKVTAEEASKSAKAQNNDAAKERKEKVIEVIDLEDTDEECNGQVNNAFEIKGTLGYFSLEFSVFLAKQICLWQILNYYGLFKINFLI